MLKPDPTRYSRVAHSRINGPEWMEPDFSGNDAEANQILEFRRPEELPADLALDLRLHEILEQALQVTSATGAVIALASGDQMVCRATAGEKSPKTGVYLNTHSGLSGVCVQSRELQRCDDTMTDARVNAAACRELEIRSIVVLPVLDGEKLWGILEVFSSAPNAFSDSDVQTLRALSRRISHTVHEAVEGETGAPAPVPPFATPPLADSAPPESMESEIVRASARMAAARRRRDYRTGGLTAAVIGLALLLGWMVGRVGWSMAVGRAPARLPAVHEDAPAVARVTPDTEPGDTITPAKPAETTPVPPAPAKAAVKAKALPAEAPAGLVVYQNGKIVFQMKDTVKPASSGAASGPIQPAVNKEEDSPAAPAQLSPQALKNSLIERVEPQYPEDARQQHIQGPVVLEALVGRDGSVRELEVVSGNPRLIKAAADAVRQWRFRPHLLKGQAIEFETRITVNFQLP